MAPGDRSTKSTSTDTVSGDGELSATSSQTLPLRLITLGLFAGRHARISVSKYCWLRQIILCGKHDSRSSDSDISSNRYQT